MSLATTLAAWVIGGILFFFTIRRWLFILFAFRAEWEQRLHSTSTPSTYSLFSPVPQLPSSPFLHSTSTPSTYSPAKAAAPETPPPSVLLLVPVRNEADALPELITALDGLDYPASQLAIVFIDDGSTDNSRKIVQQRLAGKANWHLLSLTRNAGKANALNEALLAFPHAEIIAVYDADERPLPDALRYLVVPFAVARVGAVSGRRAVRNSLASPAASYTTFEGLVHQLVTMRAKDRLNLAPALLGANCAYRRTALAEAGNFKPGALLEDSDLTLKLARLGWQTRYEPAAVSYHYVPQTISGYWQQHARWARGFNDVAKEQAGSLLFDRRLSLLLRLELIAFALGYLDRLALLLAGGLVLLKERWLAWLIAFSLATPFFQIIAALKMDHAPVALWRQIIWVPLFFGLDIAMAIAGLRHSLANLPRTWEERRVRR